MTCCGGEPDGAEERAQTELSNNKYGEPKKFDPEFKGLTKNRSCTDVACCVIFVVFVFGMIACSIVGYARGDPIKLVYPTDSYGNVCGKGAYADKKYLFFFDIIKCARTGAAVVTLGCPTPQVCVRSCPKNYWTFIQTELLEAAAGAQLSEERDKMICKYNIDPQSASKTVSKYVQNEDCAAYYVKTTSVINRCIPAIFMDIVSLAAQVSYRYNGTNYTVTDSQSSKVTGQDISDGSYFLALFYDLKEFVELIYKDVLNVWWMILVGCAVAAGLCMVWLLLLRWLAGPVVWLTIACVFGLLTFASYYSYSEYYMLKNINATSDFGLSQAFALNFRYYLSLKKTWLAFGCLTATIIAILLLLFLFLVKRICVAIELIKEASRAVGSMFTTLVWPLIPFLCQVVFCIYWAASAIFIASMGDSRFYGNATNVSSKGVNYVLSRVPCNPDSSTLGSLCDFVKYGGNEYIIPMQIFMLFMLLWVLNFIIALGHMTLAGAFSSYYWAWEKPNDIPAFPLASSLGRSLRFHLGSLAFGSFIIALVQIVRVVLEYLEYKLKDAENKVAKFIIRCLKCCFWCLEKFLKFLNKNAYIMIAIYGRNFCASAKDAFMLIMRNIVRVVVLDKLTDFLIFLSKALITGAIFILAFMWFKGNVTYFDNYIKRPELNYYLTPVIILTVCTYLMTCAFFSVYSMAVDTLFLCFLEDIEMNDGSQEKPYYMSKGLMKVIGKKNENLRYPNQITPGDLSSKVSPEVTTGRPLPQPKSVLRLKKEDSMKSET